MKSSFDKNLKSHVVDKVTSNRCNSTDVGQTIRHVSKRISKHQNKDSAAGQQLVECCGTAHNIERVILNACRGVEKLQTIKAMDIKKLKPQLNTLDGYQLRELILKKFQMQKKLNFKNYPDT